MPLEIWKSKGDTICKWEGFTAQESPLCTQDSLITSGSPLLNAFVENSFVLMQSLTCLGCALYQYQRTKEMLKHKLSSMQSELIVYQERRGRSGEKQATINGPLITPSGCPKVIYPLGIALKSSYCCYVGKDGTIFLQIARSQRKSLQYSICCGSWEIKLGPIPYLIVRP